MKGILAAVAVVAALAGGLPARAADYPTKPVRMIVGYPPGGGTDIAGRIVADALSHRLGQQFIVENRPGATGAVGTEYVVKQPADGYTLLWTSTDLTTGAAIRKTMPYTIPDDFSFIAKVAENGLVLTINREQLPNVKSVNDLLAYARANPGKILYASSGIGSTPHMAMLLWEHDTGTKMTHVPYKGVADTIPDLLSGRIQFEPITPITLAPYMTSDKIRFLGIMAANRHPAFPEIKTMAELGMPKTVATVWYGMFGPRGLPDDIVKKLETQLTEISKDPDVQKKLAAAGLSVNLIVGTAFRQAVADEYKQWRTLAVENNIVSNN